MNTPGHGLAFVEISPGDHGITSEALHSLLAMLILTYLDSPNCITVATDRDGSLTATMQLPKDIIRIISTNIEYVHNTSQLPPDFSLEQLGILRNIAILGDDQTTIHFNTTLYPAQPLNKHFCDCVDQARATLITSTIGSLQGELYSYLDYRQEIAVGLELDNQDVIEIAYNPREFPTFSVEIDGIVELYGIIQTHPNTGRLMRIKLRNFELLPLMEPLDHARDFN
ncbi:MAG: hypothetical protein Q4A82_02905 [Corynebacterium sp.]|nr:hypothetical protein [Corynebacterium sp.]